MDNGSGFILHDMEKGWVRNQLDSWAGAHLVKLVEVCGAFFVRA